ncbi:MAG: protein TolR [Methylococcaceae bacterium]
MSEINVVPYIDVTLVLLIIFMITTPMLQTGVKVDLPQAETTTVEQKDEPPIVVSIKNNGEHYLSIGGKKDELVQVGDINGLVAAALAAKPGTQVLINADQEIGYGKVVTVMAALKTAGVPNVGLLTKSIKQ